MGKLNRKTALEMVNDKNLEHFTQETFDTMEASGQIAKERGNTERVIKTGNNTYATPTIRVVKMLNLVKNKLI